MLHSSRKTRFAAAPLFHSRPRTVPRALPAILVWIAAVGAADPSSPVSNSLDQGWEFRLAPRDPEAPAHGAATGWRAARVPGSVHADLLAQRLIPDPYAGAAEAGLQWIGLGQWEYRKRFDIAPATLARRHHELVFDGLDTFADVYLNGVKLLAADNAFRTWRLPVDGRLRARGNALRVVFHSPIRRMLPQVQAMPAKIAGNYPSPYGDEPKDAMTGNFVRKPGYHYGWDWGPRYVTAGIWRGVRLESWDALRIDDLAIRQRRVDATAADLVVAVDLRAERPGPVTVAVDYVGPDGRRATLSARRDVPHAGANQLTVPVHIAHPRRWYPRGYGAQPLYRFTARVTGAGGTARAERRTGLRTVELRRDRDARGQGFAFVVNGVPVFAKGANIIPFDAFPARSTAARERRILESAAAANMNMLRVWGGGYYYDDRFYALADELGLMIWQDFMFGGGMQPAYDPAFRANVIAEARDNVRRLRDHPSIVLWCGNNEEETAWKDWGQGAALARADPAFAARVWDGYRQLFGADLRTVVAEEGGGVPYWSSSPSNDLAEKANDTANGDKHYWDVWGGPAHPVEAYLKETPRFMSEFGLQSWPSPRTIDSVVPRAEQQVDSPMVRAHQKFMAGAGNDRLLHYVREGYGEPRDFAAFVYLSQVMQAEGIELAALHHRASRPVTMGSLYWQINDVWPGASWSSIDFYGRWKALQFHARRFFAPLAVAALREDGRTRLTIVSDRTVPVQAEWRLRVIGFDGAVHGERGGRATLPPLSATEIDAWSDQALLGGADPRRSAAVFELRADGAPVSRRAVYFQPAKALALPDPGLRARIVRDRAGMRLDLSAARLARAVWIDFGAADVELSDNALTLLPGETMSLRLDTRATAEELRRRLSLYSLADAIRR